MMKLSHSYYLALLLTGLTVQAQTQTQPTQTPDGLRSLVQQAAAYYPVLKQQQEQIRAGELRVDIAHTAMRPTVNLNGSYTYITPVPQFALSLNGEDVVAKLAPNNSLNGNVSVGQTIYDFGRTEAAVRQAADNVQVLRRSLEISQQNLAYQVATVYYGIGFLQRGLSVQDSVIKTASANVRLLTTRLQNGDALEYDVLTQAVRVKTAQNRRIEIQNQLERQLATLTFLTGNPSPDISQAVDQFSQRATGNAVTQPYNLDGDLAPVLAGNKEVQLAQDRVRAAETDILVNDKAGRPNIGFSGNAGYKNGYPLNVDQLRANMAAGVGIVVPLYAGKRYQLQNQVAQMNLNASRYAVETANAQLRQSIAQLNADIRSNQTRLTNLETQVLQARKALQIANARLRNGVITNVELQSAETGVEEAELGRLNFQYQLLLNQLELKRLQGEGL
ncbi:TolC family protein [Spirosoma utsteinense]|uniref:Outer membrane protein TolC n=1 Tax=Spirosoma utsteinense TaxID=2585773 RepID=A0ABR6W2M7_9BACT|nr:TolC family protein [Spirosoma utsteinense]MBC3788192.1 outer membrane protein TolC [Spirosoma utsteinense]MBC3790459.1 outer membrane protein TolC [Spirosoma utsteinense]